SAPAASGQIIDNTTPGRFAASANWDLNSWNSQRYGANYRAARPSTQVIDAARFKVRIPRRGRYRIWARWPAHADYNPRTMFRVRSATGISGRAIDQRRNGGKWVSLGVYDMLAGDNWSVEVARRTGGKGTIVADAIRVVPFP
ncbi:MAG: N-acetylmuramoyl-L-alanine amidase, partial [Rubrobacter sp.]|nr:N-acetylmuramoyl-L-alanine amidase [Rubrobacter sp.]